MASQPGSTSRQPIDELVLDAGPLVTQQPLKGLAKKFYIPSAVVAELKDKRARDHLEQLQQAARLTDTTSRGGEGNADKVVRGDEQHGAAGMGEAGYEVEIRDPGPEALVAVIEFAKKTGDYAVLSRPDLSVLALTYALEVKRHGNWRLRDEVGGKTGQQKHSTEQQAARKADGKEDEKRGTASGKQTEPNTAAAAKLKSTDPAVSDKADGETSTKQLLSDTTLDPLSQALQKVKIDEQNAKTSGDVKAINIDEETMGTDSDSEDDEEQGGEWITPENIAKHKSRSLGLVTEADMALAGARVQKKGAYSRQTAVTHGDDGWSTVTSKSSAQPTSARSSVRNGKQTSSSNKPPPKLTVACMTGDYAVQNVLLQMGMSLVGIDGQRIKQVKSWVLRCHACFKICKEADRTFCPQCGNPTLMRTSVTSTAPEAGGNGNIHVHLKKNFQYKNRGTKYSLPLPRAGKAGGVPHAVPILREDQPEWQRGLARQRVQKQKEDRALQKALERGSDSLSARYEDVDELSILLAGKASKAPETLPALGVGRRNPNEKHRRKV